MNVFSLFLVSPYPLKKLKTTLKNHQGLNIADSLPENSRKSFGDMQSQEYIKKQTKKFFC